MRIVIDLQGAQGLSYDRGIGRYSRSFLKSFVKNSNDHDIYILLNANFPKSIEVFRNEYKDLLPKHHIIVFHTITPTDELNTANEWRTRVSELIREKFIEDLSPDFLIITSLFEGTSDNSISSIGRYTKSVPTAIIFYDLIPYIYPEKFLIDTNTAKWYRKKIKSLKQADILLSISDSARKEAIDHLGFPSEKIINISSAADNSFEMEKKHTGVKEKYHIAKPFLMHTSAYEERKNFEGLIEAFAMLPQELRITYQLVLVCKLRPEQKNFLEKHIKKVGLSNQEVILTGFVSDEDLISLYSECYLFVFPSLHEGFGLPVLEAMSCGAATIGSNSSSIPEVIGYRDALFDPASPLSIAQKIEEVLTSKTFWEALKEHAPFQAKKFSWDTTALKAIKFLEKIHQPYSSKQKKRDIYWSTDLLLDKISEIQSLQIPSEDDLKKTAIAIDENEKTVYGLLTYLDYGKNLKWRIEGPFDSSYSLALLNRETALALHSLGHDVALHSTEGPGDFEPNPAFLKSHPTIKQLYERSQTLSQQDTDVTSRNLYPPRVCDMAAPCNMLHHYAWEESAFPQAWVNDFNGCLTGMTTLSAHVEKIMIDNGVSIPLSTSGCGVDHWERIAPDESYHTEAKSFRFLHVSSCFPRKGADILLKAYGNAFCSSDDVTLIIKTFSNPHNEIHSWLEEAKKENADYPDVLIIEDDLTDRQLKALYEQCHVLVAPSRAEGFGLPMAEAMLSGLSVITTGWGGQLDFCNEITAWLIDYTFTPAKTHFELYDSIWAEPSVEHLSDLMHHLYEMPQAQRVQKAKYGRRLLLKDFKWIDVAQRLVHAERNLADIKEIPMPKVGWITTWNTKCGIASYSKHLIDAISQDITILAAHTDELLAKDENNVYRCWKAGDGHSLDSLMRTIEKQNLDTIVIQFNYSFFDFNYFAEFLATLNTKRITVVIMLHATTDSELTPHKKLAMLTPEMQECSRLIVHTPDDLNRMKSLGMVENVSLFPHGIPAWQPIERKKNDTFTLATYGFFLPHKGLLEIIDTVALLKKRGCSLQLKMVNAEYPVPQSAELISKAKEKIAVLGLEDEITLLTEYLSDEACLSELSKADLIVFPYQETGESSSAAVRYGIASGSPVSVTPLKIFDDVTSAVFKLPGTAPEKLVEGLENLIGEITQNTDTVQHQQKETERWRETHMYKNLGTRLANIVKALSHRH